MMDPANRDCYLIETGFCERLKALHFENNGDVHIPFSWDFGLWNAKMVLATVVSCVMNLMAYIKLHQQTLFFCLQQLQMLCRSVKLTEVD